MTSSLSFRLSIKEYILIPFLILLVQPLLMSQPTRSGGWSGNGRTAQQNIGRFYGKVVDESGKGMGFATVQLYGKKFDRAKGMMKDTLLSGQITEDNGDFSLEKLPIRGDFTLKISFLGYATTEQTVSFGIPGGRPGQGKGERGQGRPGGQEKGKDADKSKENSGDKDSKDKKKEEKNTSSGQRSGQSSGQWSRSGGSGGWGGFGGGGNFDKDLGNILLSSESETLQEVVVTGEASNVTLALDRKIFKVDKDQTAIGGTAEDALRNVPSLSIDLDGNLTLRNAAPQLFVDGRPTTLSLDQIPADAIETVEVITNPSAKFDASGGQAGIVNIVMKKDRKPGYNGNIRMGVDTRGALNGGGNINIREGKVNAFASAFVNQRKSISESETDRQNLFGNPLTNVLQASDQEFTGVFANIRTGVDWFVDNRNTITFAGSLTRGTFDSENFIDIRTDSIFSDRTSFSDAVRDSESERMFRNLGGSILYKHLFSKEGKEWTADLSYNRVRFEGDSRFNTLYLGSNATTNELQEALGNTRFVTFQTDYVEPLAGNAKIEAGARAALRNNDNTNFSFFQDPLSGEFIRATTFADEYKFEDLVLAAYTTFSQEFDTWGYQIGLRAESSQYTGELPETNATFENDYPISLFPSVFLTKKLNENDDLQLSYSRRINRPNFFQLMPFTDFSDSLNLRRGNPDLLPEFVNSLELTYHNIFERGDNILISAYFKQANDLITAYQFTEFNEDLGEDLVVRSYANSNNSIAYGMEFTMKNTLIKNVELTSNINLYNSRVDASNVEEGLINDQFTWFIKENLQIRLPKSFTIQISGEYRSRAAFTPSDGGRRFGGWRGGPTNTAQGYTLDNWYVDFSIRKSVLKRKGTITLSMPDVFATRQNGTYTESDFFIQDTWRIRNPQVLRLNFSYRFGKMDTSLFKRKNNKIGTEGMDMM